MNTPAPKTGPDAALGNLMAAALDVPAAPEQPAVPDDTLARTGNTADHQAGWFAGMEQGQANAKHNAAIRAGAAPSVSTAGDPHPARDWELTCHKCDGSGHVYVKHQVAERKTDLQEFKQECECCEGRGFVFAFQDIPGIEEYVKACRPAPAAGDALDAAVGAAIGRACAELPFGYNIELSLEGGYGGARLIDPEDRETELDQDERDLAKEINAGIDAAIAAQPRRLSKELIPSFSNA